MATHHRVPHVTPADVRFLAALAPTPADGVRRPTLTDDDGLATPMDSQVVSAHLSSGRPQMAGRG